MACELVDPTLLRVLEGQIETLTTSGKNTLDEGVMKDMKRILKQSDEFVKHCYYCLLPLLGKNHSEIRLSAFQIVDKIFNRSHCFRELVIDNFQQIMDLVLETDPDQPLPLPKPAANQLKRDAIRAVHKWNETFSGVYKKLSLGYNYLDNCKKIDFVGMEARSIAQRRRAEEEARRKEAMQREKINTALREIQDMKEELKACLTQAESCLILLLPDPDTFAIHSLRRLSSSGSTKSRNKRSRRKSSTLSNQTPPIIKAEKQIGDSSGSKNAPHSIKQEPSIEQNNFPSAAKSSENDSLPIESSEDKEASRISPVLTDVKCEQCKRKGCSPTCVNYVLYSSQNTANTELLSSQESDRSLSRDAETNSTASNSNESQGASHSSKVVERKSNQNNNFTRVAKTSRCDETTEKATNESVNSSHASTVVKEEPTLVENNSDSDDFQEISSSEEEDEEDEIESENEEAESEDEGAVKQEEFNDSDLEDILESMDGARQHGLPSQQWSMNIELPSERVQIEETEDNEHVIGSLNDVFQLIQHRFMPSVQRWIQIFTKVGDETQIKMCIDTRQLLERVLSKISKLEINKRKKTNPDVKNEEESDDDADFEEVASKDGYEADIPDHLKPKVVSMATSSSKQTTSQEWKPYDLHDESETDPTSLVAAVKHMQPVKGKSGMRREHSKFKTGTQLAETSDSRNTHISSNPEGSTSKHGAISPGSGNYPENSRRKKLLNEAPMLPFNTDLRYWGEKIETPLKVSYHSEHRFWTPNSMDTEEVDQNALASMTSRLINFTGKFEPVKHQCRAPLPNGKLCPRMDRIKCPFHGKIIPRDIVGKPTRAEDIAHTEQAQKEKEVPAWEDVELQREIEAATGKTLQRQTKKKGRKKKEPEYPNLTDIKKKINTSRSRLENKVLSAKAVKRVAGKLDLIDEKRAKDKFGNQFHYALKNRPV